LEGNKLANSTHIAPVYRTTSIGEILEAARLYSKNKEMKKKTVLASKLGITYGTLTSIESGTSRISLNDALDWCDACEDYAARQAVLHIFGRGRVPTDIRLIKNLDRQLNNMKEQCLQALKSLDRIAEMNKDMRPGRGLSNSEQSEYEDHLSQIDDVYHAASCVMMSAEMNLGISWTKIINAWTSEAIVDQVAISSVDRLINIEREKAFV
jgi:hypothetical protein